MTWPTELDRLLRTDPRDVGCAEALRTLHLYVELVHLSGAEDARARYPGVVAHLSACGPCEEDFRGLLEAVTREASEG